MKIRKMRPGDIDECTAIVRTNYSVAFAKSAAKELKEMFGSAHIKPLYFVAEEKGEIVGFAGCVESWVDYGTYEIFWLNVAPEKQRRGIGKKLVATILTELKKRKPDLVLLSTTAPDYYKKHFGFRTLAIMTEYRLMGLKMKK
jgi:predicted N-acetyltransferase YhbS